MSTSGQINTNTTYDSYFWVKWSQSGDQDIPNNRTLIAWSCGVYCGHSFYSNAIKMSAFTINGVQVYGGGTYSNYSKGDHTIASGTMWINHSSDGTKTFSISSFTGWLYSSYNYSSNGGSYALTQIPRKATITAAADFTDVDNPSISFSNPGGFTLDVWLEPNPVGDHLCVKENIPNTGTYTWKLTDAEREALRNKCAGKSCTIRLGLYTTVGGTVYHDYKDKTYTMTDNAATKPEVSMTLSPVNSSLGTTFDGMYIQGKSKVKAVLDIEKKYGATIVASNITVEDIAYASPYESGILTRSGTQTIKATVKDSRGFYGTCYEYIPIIPYSKPLVVPLSSENAVQCYRSDGNGKRVGNSTSLWIKAKFTYYNLEMENACSLQWRWKPAAEVWNDDKHIWNTLANGPVTATTGEYNALVPGVVFDLKEAYTVQIRAIDTLGEQDVKTLEIPTRDVALHLGKGGKNVAVGTYCDYSEDYTFYSEWKAIFDKDVVVGGDVLIGENKTTLRDYILSVINGGG